MDLKPAVLYPATAPLADDVRVKTNLGTAHRARFELVTLRQVERELVAPDGSRVLVVVPVLGYEQTGVREPEARRQVVRPCQFRVRTRSR